MISLKIRSVSFVRLLGLVVSVLATFSAAQGVRADDFQIELNERGGRSERGGRESRYPGNEGSFDCKDGSKLIPVDNAVVLKWKSNTQNGWHSRAHVEGTITRIFPVRNDHDHFEIQIGPNKSDVLEVVYNTHFGELPTLEVGARVEACGDFINAFAQNGPYAASPSGAIIHWVHFNPRNQGHEHGYVAIEGQLYGNQYSRGGRH